MADSEVTVHTNPTTTTTLIFIRHGQTECEYTFPLGTNPPSKP